MTALFIVMTNARTLMNAPALRQSHLPLSGIGVRDDLDSPENITALNQDVIQRAQYWPIAIEGAWYHAM